MRDGALARTEAEDQRRRQLIDATIEALANVGFSACTLGEIGRRAGVSPGLVAHYFGDKDGLLEATLRHLVTRLGHSAARRPISPSVQALKPTFASASMVASINCRRR